ncbi:hypothetical protein EZS27_020549 [termite gut metagenome]|uniref:Uncharacterized protein n=1 Tax=termite gut metagenome TaxID=433724 RepID=A0A5J4RAX5_9ZZZZ
MEAIIRAIQNRINECIRHDYRFLENRIFLKLQYFSEEQSKSFLNQELVDATDELANLHDNTVIQSITDYTDYAESLDFLWESTFIETLTSGEKKKHANFDTSTLDVKQYTTKNDSYDEALPYFSKIVKFIVLSKYVLLLNKKAEYYQSPKISVEVKKMSIEPMSDVKPQIKQTFECHFDDRQIEILTTCINEAHIFTESVTTETVKRIFDCELEKYLRVKNNRLLAYFFISLDDRNLITHYWQSVCQSHPFFLSSLKGKPLKQSDLSTATNESREKLPKGSEIIDKYFKELKKH